MRSQFTIDLRIQSSAAKTPKIGKRGFRSRQTPISPHPRKGRFESTPFSMWWAVGGMGIYGPEAPFSGVGVNGGVSTPEPSFPDFGGPCTGQGGRGQCTWVKTGRFGIFVELCFLALGGRCLQMLFLSGCQIVPALPSHTGSIHYR